MNVLDLKNTIVSLYKETWLHSSDFDCSDSILLKSLDEFQSDYNRWYSGSIELEKLCITPQLLAVLMYRISHNINIFGGGKPDSYSLLGRHIGQIELYYSAQIGHSFKINHGVGSVIGARCKIGDNFTIHQNCTIGDRKGGRPTIGNNVIMYAGSMVLGDIHIGDNSIIAANSVVIESCPPNSVLIGSPAKIKPLK